MAESAAKKCPDCAEEVKREASVCRHCGKRWKSFEVKRHLIDNPTSDEREVDAAICRGSQFYGRTMHDGCTVFRKMAFSGSSISVPRILEIAENADFPPARIVERFEQLGYTVTRSEAEAAEAREVQQSDRQQTREQMDRLHAEAAQIDRPSLHKSLESFGTNLWQWIIVIFILGLVIAAIFS